MKELITRSIPVTPDSYDPKTRSVGVTLFSGDSVTIWDPERWEPVREFVMMNGVQIPANGQIPLLDCHDRSSIKCQPGSIRELQLKDGKWVGRAYFDSTEDGMNAEIKCREKHVTDISAGYSWNDSSFIGAGQSTEIEGRKFEGPCRVTRSCTLKEGSLTPIGADTSTKVRSESITPVIRKMLQAEGLSPDATEAEAMEFLKTQMKQRNNPAGDGQELTPLTQRKEISMSDQPTPLPVDANEIKRAERERVASIDAIAADNTGVKEINALRKEAMEKGWLPEQFGNEVLKRRGTQVLDISSDKEVGIVGLSTRDIKQYSIMRAIQQIAETGTLSGIEKEASDAVRTLAGGDRKHDRHSFSIPGDILSSRMTPVNPEVRARAMAQRAAIDGLSVDTFAYGGALVPTDLLGGSMIEMLRNMPLVSQLGARTLTGLRGNVAIPKQSGGATAYWVPPSGGSTVSKQGTSQLPLTPHALTAETGYEKELLFQSCIDVENFVREDIMQVLAIEKDRAAINGSGNDGEPQGILNMTGLATSVTFGGAATWAKVLEFETNVATGNALKGQCAYLTTPAVRGKWKAIQKANALPFLWEAGLNGGGIVNGYRAEATNQVPSHKVIYGNWNDFIFAEWAGIDVVVDLVTLASYRQIRIIISLWCDMGARHTASFCISTDTGAA
jgi:HK97 family phage major capsid protein